MERKAKYCLACRLMVENFTGQTTRDILLTVDVLIIILIFLASIVVCLLTVNFLRNTLLIFLFFISVFISVSDICITLIQQALFAVLIVRFFDQTCTFDMIAEFFAIFLIHASGYGVACINLMYICALFPQEIYFNNYKEKSFCNVDIHLFNFLFSKNFLCPWNTIRCL